MAAVFQPASCAQRPKGTMIYMTSAALCGRSKNSPAFKGTNQNIYAEGHKFQIILNVIYCKCRPPIADGSGTLTLIEDKFDSS